MSWNKQTKKFEQIGKINDGELIIKYPGLDFKINYSGGKAYLNKNKYTGFIELKSRYFVAKEAKDYSDTPLGILGSSMVDQINSNELAKEGFSKRNIFILYSKTEDGKEIIVMPGINSPTEIYDDTENNAIIGQHNMSELPLFGQLYELYETIVKEGELKISKNLSEDDILALVPKANAAYENVLKLIMKKEENQSSLVDALTEE